MGIPYIGFDDPPGSEGVKGEPFPIAVCKKHFGDEEADLEGDVRNYL